MLSSIIHNTDSFIASVPKLKRKKYGQFFTNMATANFMASLFCFDLTKPELHLLDAGAGTGILSAAVIDKLIQSGYTGRIYLTCYETDELIQKKTTGFYHLLQFEAEGALVDKLETAYRRDERVIRFLTFRLDKYAYEYTLKRRSKYAAKQEEK